MQVNADFASANGVRPKIVFVVSSISSLFSSVIAGPRNYQDRSRFTRHPRRTFQSGTIVPNLRWAVLRLGSLCYLAAQKCIT